MCNVYCKLFNSVKMSISSKSNNALSVLEQVNLTAMSSKGRQEVSAQRVRLELDACSCQTPTWMWENRYNQVAPCSTNAALDLRNLLSLTQNSSNKHLRRKGSLLFQESTAGFRKYNYFSCNIYFRIFTTPDTMRGLK